MPSRTSIDHPRSLEGKGTDTSAQVDSTHHWRVFNGRRI